MQTRLLLVRHGETEWHAENRYAGSSEVALTARGITQAEALAGYLTALPAGERPTRLYSSPQGRAQRTASPSAAALGLEPVPRDDLRELDFGIMEGRTITELRETDNDLVERFLADPVADAFPDSEPPARAAERGAAALRTIAAAETGPVLVVAHNTLLRLTLCHLLGIPLRRYRAVLPKLENAAITEVAVHGDRTSLLRFNQPVENRDTVRHEQRDISR